MSGMIRLTELLPCPFCGGAPTLALGNGAYGVNCRCKGEAFIQTYGGSFVTTGFTREQAKENAIAAWNRRASQAAPAPSDGLREALEPFAKAADIRLCGEWRDDEKISQTDVPFYITFGDLRRASAAISASPAQEGEPHHD